MTPTSHDAAARDVCRLPDLHVEAGTVDSVSILGADLLDGTY
jgi:hypothetical protein